MQKNVKEETLGQRIKAQRIRMGLTQEDLAEKMCTTKSMISYYENDHGDMKQSMIAEFARVLCTTAEYLTCGVAPFEGLSDRETEALTLFTKMDSQVQDLLLIQMRALANNTHISKD